MTASSPSAQFQLMLSPAEQLSWSPKLPGTGCLPDCDTSLKGKHLTDANPVAFNCASLPSRSQPFLVLTGLFFRSTESTVGVNFSSRHTFLVPQDTQPWTSLFRDPELLLLYEQVVRKTKHYTLSGYILEKNNTWMVLKFWSKINIPSFNELVWSVKHWCQLQWGMCVGRDKSDTENILPPLKPLCRVHLFSIEHCSRKE